MIPPPPHRITSVYNPRRMSETGAGDSGLAARDVVAEVVRVTLLDDALRRDRREDLAACARARRLGFLAQAVSEVTPPEPVPANQPDPCSSDGAARYRAAAAVGDDRFHDDAARPFRTDLSI